MVKFIKTEQKQEIEDPTVGVVIWEWKDSNLLGKPTENPVDQVRRAVPCPAKLTTNCTTARVHL